MEKISITIAWKGDDAEILAAGSAKEAEAAYNAARIDPQYDFVGYLRKPMWLKREAPKMTKRRKIQARGEVAQKELTAAEKKAADLAGNISDMKALIKKSEKALEGKEAVIGEAAAVAAQAKEEAAPFMRSGRKSKAPAKKAPAKKKAAPKGEGPKLDGDDK